MGNENESGGKEGILVHLYEQYKCKYQRENRKVKKNLPPKKEGAAMGALFDGKTCIYYDETWVENQIKHLEQRQRETTERINEYYRILHEAEPKPSPYEEPEQTQKRLEEFRHRQRNVVSLDKQRMKKFIQQYEKQHKL